MHVSKWVVRLFALVVTSASAPIALGLVLIPGSGFGAFGIAALCSIALEASLISWVLLGIPGLVALDRLRWDGLRFRLILGVVVGTVAALLTQWLLAIQLEIHASVKDVLLALPCGMGLGAASAVLYWICTHWFERGLSDLAERRALEASLTPDERTMLRPRLERHL